VRFVSRGAFALALAAALPAVTAAPPPTTRSEIQALLRTVGYSKCQFYRNGRWYGGRDAQRHLKEKYDYLVNRGLIHDTEDFIAGAGTRSSVSNRPYRVRCPNQPEQPSAQWLHDRVHELRQLHSPR